MSLSISTRLVLIVVLLVSLTASSISYFLYENGIKILTEHALLELSQDLQRDGGHITSQVAELQRDVLFLSESPPLPGLIRSAHNKGYDPVGKSSRQQWQVRLASLFKTLLSTNPAYMQVRLMNAQGREWIRMNRTANGISITPQRALQDKSDTDYIRMGKQLKPGELYFSPINLNREFGQISLPHIPVLRCITPVYDGNRLFAFIIINLNFSYVLKELEQSYQKQSQTLYVTNSQGAYLSHPDPRRRFAIELGHYYRIQEDFPQLANLYAPDNRQTGFNLLPDDPSGDILVFVKIPLIKNQPDRFIGLGLSHDLSKIIAEESRVLQKNSAIVVLLVLLSILLATAFGNLLVRPLKQIAASLQGYRYGEIPNLPLKRKDEIGVLARALFNMADNVFSSHQELRTLNAHLEDEVEQRTAEVHQHLQMVNAINTAQDAFIRDLNPRTAFDHMLVSLLDLSQSEFGFIGEVLRDEDDTPYVRIYVTTNIAWDEATRQFYADNIEKGLEFRQLDNLFGAVVLTGQPVISNDPLNDPRAKGLPPGHPELRSFMGIPVSHADRLIGMVAIANRIDGYSEDLIESLSPFLNTCANIIFSHQVRLAAEQSAADLSETRRELERVTNISPVIFYVTRAYGDFGTTFVSPNIKQLMGYDPEECIANPAFWRDNIHPDDRQRIFDGLGTLFETGHHVHNYRFRNKDGHFHWVHDELQLIRDEHGKPREQTGYWLDITERKKAEQALLDSEAKFRSIINSSPMGIFIYKLVDERLIVSDYNPAADKILGVDCSRFVGLSIEQAFPNTTGSDAIQHMCRAARDGIPCDTEDVFYDERSSIAGAYSVHVFQTEPDTLAVMFVDITERKNAEHKLQQSERELATIIDSLPLMMFLKETDELRFMQFNRAGEQLLGLSRDELLGKNDYDFFPRAQADFFTAKDREVIAAGNTIDIPEEPVQTPSGERILHTRKTVITDAEGKPIYLLGLSEDITEAKQIQDELARFKATLDQTQDCVFMFAADSLQYFYVNQGATFLVGYSNEELMQMHPYDINDRLRSEKDFREFVQPIVSANQPSLTFETEYRCKDQSLVPVEVIVQYISDRQEYPRFVAMVRDITERRKIDRMKNEFISTVSHELRTPLTSIHGSLGLITGGATGELPESLRQMIQIASNNTDRLLLLINDILDIQKIESGQMDFQFKPIDVMQLLEQAIEANAAYAEQYKVHFRIVRRLENVQILGDHARLMQVLNNLMSNAAKFSPEGGEVELAAELDHDTVRISVTDHGEGIPDDFQPSLFEQFTQSDSSDSRQKGGTGLGLSIVKAITEKHRGRVDYRTAAGQGTTMLVEFPLFAMVTDHVIH